MLSLVLWLSLPWSGSDWPRRVLVVLASVVTLLDVGRYFQANLPWWPLYLAFHAAAIVTAAAVSKYPERLAPAALSGYLLVSYRASLDGFWQHAEIAAAALGAAVLVALVGDRWTLLGLAAVAAAQAVSFRAAELLWMSPPVPPPATDPLDPFVPGLPLTHFAVACLALIPAALRCDPAPTWQWGLLLVTGTLAGPLPWTWLPLILVLALTRCPTAAVGLVLAGLLAAGPTWWYAARTGRFPDGAVARQAALAQRPPGSVLTMTELAALLPPAAVSQGRLRFPEVPPLEATTRPLEKPEWLAVSNNPELVRSLEGTRVLMRVRLPSGSGRLFVSHFNETERPAQLLVDLRNTGPDPVHLSWGRTAGLKGVASPLELGAQLWEAYSRAPEAGPGLIVEPGTSTRVTLDDLHGNGMWMSDLTLSGPLEMAVAMAPSGTAPDLSGPVQDRIFRQSRGLFPAPDITTQARFQGDLGGLTLHEQHLRGSDQGREDELKGNYGAVAHVSIDLARRAAILLVPRGGELAWPWDGRTLTLPPFGALVLAQQEAGTWTFDYTLPSNSFAPVSLLLVPLP